jgi:hypothetical protein
MATRMQQRRGTAAQWTSANPILNAGEMGWESDTNKFKIGDGINHWADLDYFIDQSSTVNPSFGSSITFEGLTANAYETTIAVTDPTADRTITFPDASGSVVVADGSGNVTVSGNLTVQGTTTTVDSTTINVVNSFTFEGSTANAYETTLQVTDPTADRTITLPDASGTLAIEADVTSALSGKLNISGGTMAGALSMGNHKINSVAEPVDAGDATTKSYVDTGLSNHAGDTSSHGISSTIVGTTETQTLQNKTISSVDNTITITASTVSDFTEAAQDAIGNSLGTGLSYNDSTGAISVDTATIQAKVSGVSDTEIGYLDGVSSAIQTQLNGKASSVHTHSLIDVTDVTASAAELNTLDGITASTAELNILDGVTSSAAELNILDGATLSTTELNYVDGVTSAIQTQLDAKLALAGGTMTGAIAMGTNKITGLGDPTSDQDAATKAYVDAATAGLNVHASVRVATTANITNTIIAEDLENGKTIDGVTLVTGDRVLVKNQTVKSENGIYIVPANGVASRATDYDSTPEVDAGDFIFVESGTVNGKSGWVQTNTITAIGTDDIEFTQFSGSGTYSAGTGLTLTGSTFSINTATTADLSTAQTLTNKTISGSSNTITNVSLTSGVTGTLPVANGGTGVTSSTGSGSNVLSNSPTLVTPTLGAATATSIAFSDGTQTKEGVPSRTPINQQSGTTYTTVLSDRDTLIECSNASAITVTIPPNSSVAYPVGTSIDILQTGSGQVTIAAGSGVTVNSTPGLKLRAQWSSATLFKRASDTWVVMGDLSA